jgi:PAS domain S-box-containing protein
VTNPAPDAPRLGINSEEAALLVDAVQDYAIFLLGPDGEIRTWNKGAERIMGYDDQEVIGRHFSIFYEPGDQLARKPQRELDDATRDGRVEDEGWRLRKDGTRFWANTVITLLKDASGETVGFSKVTRDVTARRQAEEELRQSSEIFQLLVSSVRDYAIFMLDPEGRIATWNVGAQRIKGYRPDEIIGHHFSEFYPEEDLKNGKPDYELRVARAEGSVEDEGWRIRKDGSRFWANVVITAVHDRHGELRGFAKVTRDITERKKTEETQLALLEQREARILAEEERRRAEASYQVAQESNRAKDEFLMTLSHELRTPMTAILGWARMLPTIPPDDPLFHEAMGSIMSSAQLQARLIDDILDVSRIVSGKLRLAPEILDIAGVVMNAVDAVSPTAEARDITLTTSLAPALGSMIADATRLQQVIWNLITNAVKFTPRGGKVQVAARRTASHLDLSVTDDGEGIDPQFLPHIFEPFRQAEAPNTRVHGGLGLGLSIVRYIVEAHGGSISAESEGRGKGAKFTVMLPIRAMKEGAGKTAPAVNFLHRDRLVGLDVVVVDDDPEARKLVSAVLRASGANVRAFEAAQPAVEAIDLQPPAMVMTDIAMPDMDGYTFTQVLRERPYGQTLKVIALTAFPAGPDYRTMFDAYLSKPIDPILLIDEVARIAKEPRG